MGQHHSQVRDIGAAGQNSCIQLRLQCHTTMKLRRKERGTCTEAALLAQAEKGANKALRLAECARKAAQNQESKECQAAIRKGKQPAKQHESEPSPSVQSSRALRLIQLQSSLLQPQASSSQAYATFPLNSSRYNYLEGGKGREHNDSAPPPFFPMCPPQYRSESYSPL